jgi:hypothetical protein
MCMCMTHIIITLIVPLLQMSADKGRGGSQYKLLTPGPNYVAYVFVFLGSIIIC